jgi:hypothetical protein
MVPGGVPFVGITLFPRRTAAKIAAKTTTSESISTQQLISLEQRQ